MLAYLPDHEPALGAIAFPTRPLEWNSEVDLAANTDLLIHDGQYSTDEYSDHVGWGLSSVNQAVAFATLAEAKRLVTFHHDPGHTDVDLDRMMNEAMADASPAFRVTTALEGAIVPDLNS